MYLWLMVAMKVATGITIASPDYLPTTWSTTQYLTMRFLKRIARRIILYVPI